MTQVWRRGEDNDDKTDADEDEVVALITKNANCTYRDLRQWLTMPEYKLKATLARLERSAKIQVSKFGSLTRYNPY